MQGIAIKPLVVLLGVRTKDVVEPCIFEEVNRKVGHHLAGGIEAIAGKVLPQQFLLSKMTSSNSTVDSFRLWKSTLYEGAS